RTAGAGRRRLRRGGGRTQRPAPADHGPNQDLRLESGRGEGPGTVRGHDRRGTRLTSPPVPRLQEAANRLLADPPADALRGVSLTIREGELVAIVGQSGSGKTTLVHVMGTLERPTRGVVRVAGQDVSEMSDRELSGLRAWRLGFVFQQFFLLD